MLSKEIAFKLWKDSSYVNKQHNNSVESYRRRKEHTQYINKLKQERKLNEEKNFLKLNTLIDIPYCKNENDFSHWFEDNLWRFGIRIVTKSWTGYDYVAEMVDTKKPLTIELEYASWNFLPKNHNRYYIDLIISYLRTESSNIRYGIPVVAVKIVESKKALNSVLGTDVASLSIDCVII